MTSSRREYDEVGARACADVLHAIERAAPADGTDGKWLDFGCGSGRLALRLIAAGIDLHGVDVDRPAIAWLRARYADRFAIAPPVPPLGLPTGGFSVVLAISVFSHLDEPAQQAWLAELSRVLRPGGLLVASTHGRDLLVTRGDLGRERAGELLARGFMFAPGDGPFNEDSAFHERRYMESVWGRWFTLELFAARGLMGYQDLSVWRTTRRDTSPAP